MFESLTTEALLSFATAGVSALAICGIVLALRATRHKHEKSDIDAIVARAPYNRLHNVIQPDVGM